MSPIIDRSRLAVGLPAVRREFERELDLFLSLAKHPLRREGARLGRMRFGKGGVELECALGSADAVFLAAIISALKGRLSQREERPRPSVGRLDGDDVLA